MKLKTATNVACPSSSSLSSSVCSAALSEKSKIAGVPVSAAMSTANDVSTVRFGRWWWCWRRRRRNTTYGPTTMPTGYAKTIVLLGVFAVLCALLGTVDAVARTKPDEPRSKGGHKDAEPVIEEVNAKQLERLLNEKDFVAVYWCKCSSHPGTVDVFVLNGILF